MGIKEEGNEENVKKMKGFVIFLLWMGIKKL